MCPNAAGASLAYQFHMQQSTSVNPPRSSRAVLRKIEPGNTARCKHCDEEVKFQAQIPSAKRQRVICNVYQQGKWDRVEHFHPDCYDEAGKPYGEVVAGS